MIVRTCKLLSDGMCEVTGKKCDDKMYLYCDVYKEWSTGWRYNEDGEVVMIGEYTYTFDDLCDRMKELHAKKGDGYVKDVIGELPIEMWTSQIVIKATRAHYAKRDEKRVDELFDTAVYCLLTLEEMARQGVDMAPIIGVGNNVERN